MWIDSLRRDFAMPIIEGLSGQKDQLCEWV